MECDERPGIPISDAAVFRQFPEEILQDIENVDESQLRRYKGMN
jgi:hypothetical protein